MIYYELNGENLGRKENKSWQYFCRQSIKLMISEFIMRVSFAIFLWMNGWSMSPNWTLNLESRYFWANQRSSHGTRESTFYGENSFSLHVNRSPLYVLLSVKKKKTLRNFFFSKKEKKSFYGIWLIDFDCF